MVGADTGNGADAVNGIGAVNGADVVNGYSGLSLEETSEKLRRVYLEVNPRTGLKVLCVPK